MNPTGPTETPTPAGAAGPPPAGPARRASWLVLSAAVAAGVAAWLVGETNLVRVKPRLVPMNVMGVRMNASTAETQQAAKRATAARVYGVLGGAVGLALGVAGALARRAPAGAPAAPTAAAALAPALLGAVLGAAGAYAAAYAAVPVFERHRDALAYDLIPSILLHGVIWCAFGAAAGLAFGAAAGGDRRLVARSALGGAFGALVGAALFDVLGALLFASDQTGDPISLSPASRLFAMLVASLATAAGVLASTHRRPRAPGDGR